MEIQVLMSQWLETVANSMQLGYGFSAGMVSAVNPCGFALLPAYLSLFLGAAEDGYEQRPLWLRFLKAVWVSIIVTAGFSILFMLTGALFLLGNAFLTSIVPWFSLVVSAGLIVLGLWILTGNHFSSVAMLRLAGKIGDPREISLSGFFLFGLAFGFSSLGCTLPIFLAVVGSSFAQGGFLEGMKQFVAYVFGIAFVLTFITVSISFLKEGIMIPYLRKLQPYIEKLSALFLISAGIFIIYYWFTSGGLFF